MPLDWANQESCADPEIWCRPWPSSRITVKQVKLQLQLHTMMCATHHWYSVTVCRWLHFDVLIIARFWFLPEPGVRERDRKYFIFLAWGPGDGMGWVRREGRGLVICVKYLVAWGMLEFPGQLMASSWSSYCSCLQFDSFPIFWWLLVYNTYMAKKTHRKI